jgi:predicted HAD superfamily Cof-like phosphohydrolase
MSEVIIEDGDQEIARFSFHREQAGDVVTMVVKASPGNNNKIPHEFLGWMKRVFAAQAEAISTGLHLRDHDFPDLMGDVAAFHAKFGREYLGKPRMLPADLHDFRKEFHKEETEEYSDEYDRLSDAVDRKDRRDIVNSLELQLDALVDSVWVVLGTADLQFGRGVFFEAWKRVVKANMAKIRKDVAGDGHEDSGRAPKYDIVKPAGWEAPDHRDLITDNAIIDELFAAPVAGYSSSESPDRYSDTRQI